MLSPQELYTAAPWFVFLCVGVLGLMVGSFLNVVIYRLPKMMELEWQKECQEYIASSPDLSEVKEASKSTPKPAEPFNLAVPRSACPKCGHKIASWENIPVVSYLFLRGRCSGCKAPISCRYPIIELATGLLGVAALWMFPGDLLQAGLAIALLWSLLCLTMIDIDHHLLPDAITLPLLWAGLLINSFGIFTDLKSALYGAAAGYLALWSVFWLFKLATGKEGMGYGDFKLLAALGAWFGWQYLGLMIILSAFVGSVLGIAAILIMGRDKAQPLPFGPYLAGAGVITLFWGETLLTSYLQFASPAS